MSNVFPLGWRFHAERALLMVLPQMRLIAADLKRRATMKPIETETECEDETIAQDDANAWYVKPKNNHQACDILLARLRYFHPERELEARQ